MTTGIRQADCLSEGGRRSFILYAGCQQRLDGRLVVDERRIDAVAAGLRDVFHDETVDLDVFVQSDQRSVRFRVFVTVNVTDDGVSDAASECEPDDGQRFDGVFLPSVVAWRLQAEVALVGMDVFDGDVVHPDRLAFVDIVLRDEHGVVAVAAIDAADADMEQRFAAGEDADA